MSWRVDERREEGGRQRERVAKGIGRVGMRKLSPGERQGGGGG